MTGAGLDYLGDWYLPSLHELTMLIAKKNDLGGFASFNYWYSTDRGYYDSGLATGRNTINEYLEIDKNTFASVRCIRQF